MKKFLPLFLVFIIVGHSFFYHPQKANAIGEGAVARVVAGSVGERVLAAVAEKAGVKYATKTAREIAVKKWNLSLYEKVEKAIAEGKLVEAENLKSVGNAYKGLSEQNVIPLLDKPGFGKVVLTGALFLTGADLLVDGANALVNAGNQQALFLYMNSLEDNLISGAFVTSYRGATAFLHDEYPYFGFPIGTNGSRYGIYNSSYNWTLPFYTEIFNIKADDPNRLYCDVNIVHIQGGSLINQKLSNMSLAYPTTPIPDFNKVGFIPKPSDLPDMDVMPWVNNPPAVVPDSVEVVIPMANSYPEQITKPWNEPMPDINPKPIPDPGDGGGDTGGDGDTGNNDPTKKKIDWSKLAPALGAMKGVFPLSIPWDMLNFIEQFNVEPKTPKFDLKSDRVINLGGRSIPINFDWTIDFSWLDGIAKICRWGMILVFDIFMITALRKYTPD